jgi:hypothetical protein
VPLPTGWPFDAKNVVYGVNVPVPSSNLNAIQDRIVDAHRIRNKVIFNAAPNLSGASPTAIPGWFCIGGGHGGGVVQPSWRCQDAASGLVIPIELPVAAKIWTVQVKYELNAAAGIAFDLISECPYFDTHATDPAGTLLGTVSPGGVGPDVETIDIIATPHEIVNDDICYVLIHSADVGDDIFGIRVHYTPITPTP